MDDAEWLKLEIFDALNESESIEGQEDEYSKRYYVDIKIRNLDKQAKVRTSWIILHGENFPRLTTCFVLE
jgi:hypothetical protein